MTSPATDQNDKIVSLFDFLAYAALLEKSIPKDVNDRLEAASGVLAKEVGDIFSHEDLDVWTDNKGTPYLRASSLSKMFNSAATVSQVPADLRKVFTDFGTLLVDMLPDHTAKLPQLKPVAPTPKP